MEKIEEADALGGDSRHGDSVDVSVVVCDWAVVEVVLVGVVGEDVLVDGQRGQCDFEGVVWVRIPDDGTWGPDCSFVLW